jgi:hypothetical protein
MKCPAKQKGLFKAILELETKISNRFGSGYGKGLLDMLTRRTPVGVTNLLCHQKPTSMFYKLAHEGALELTVEALALREEFAAIIPASTCDAARRRLAKHGMAVAA